MKARGESPEVVGHVQDTGQLVTERLAQKEHPRASWPGAGWMEALVDVDGGGFPSLGCCGPGSTVPQAGA